MIGRLKVGFVLVCWNNQDLLQECLESIKSQTHENHVTIMVDNGSQDESVKYTRENYDWVDIHETRENLGFAKGNNEGVAYAYEVYPDIDYIVLLNTDARLKNDWLATLLTFAINKPLGALFQSITLDYYDHNIMDSTHIFVSSNGSGTQSGWRAPFVGDRGPKKVFGVNAAAAMVSTKFIQEQPFTTLFDERMFMYLEDVDLSARATIMGWDNYLVSGTEAYHMGSASSEKNPGFSLYMTYRNNIAVLAKNIPLTMLVKMIPSMITADRHTIKHLRKIDQPDFIKSLLKGRIVGLVRLPLYLSGILKMHKYRKEVSKEYLRQLMQKGY